MNKFDKPEDKKLTLNNFKKYLLETLKKPEVEYFPISSEYLLLNVFKYQNYSSYMLTILTEKKDDEENINNYIQKKFREDFNVEIEDNLDDDENSKINDAQNKEYRKFHEKIKDKINLSQSDYFYYKQHFKKNDKKYDSKETELKITNKISTSFRNIIDNYINFENFNDLINKILPKLGIREEEINDMKFDMKRRKINGLKNKPKAIYDDFKEIINKLVELKEHKYIENIKDETSFFQNFMNSEIKLRIPVLGCYSSGKSSLLNNLIGKNILPVNTEVSTNIGLILNYVHSIKDICLLKADLKKSKNIFEDYYYFSDNIKIYSKLDYMKEIILLMNNTYPFGDEILDILITFIQKLDILNILQYNNIIGIINDVFKYKEEDNLKEYDKWFEKLDSKFIQLLDNIHKNLKKYLKQIIEANKKNKLDFVSRKSDSVSFLKLYIPINAFDELNLSEEEKNQIELIDFPGLNSENNLFDISVLKKLIKFSNGFIFVTRCSINEGNTKDVINTIITKIQNRKMLDFSFDTSLFVLTNIEKYPNLDLVEKANEINDIICTSDLRESFTLKQKKFLITKFSNEYYKKFLNDKSKTKDIEILYSYLKKNNKYQINEINYIKKLKKDFNNSFFSKLKNQNDNNIPQDEEYIKNKQELMKLISVSASSLTHEYEENIENIIKNFMIFNKNINQHQDYINSNAPNFLQQFKKLIYNSKKSYSKSLDKSIIYMAKYLKEKLSKIKMNFYLKKANMKIEEISKNERIDEISKYTENTIQKMNNKFETYKKNFKGDIDFLIGQINQDK